MRPDRGLSGNGRGHAGGAVRQGGRASDRDRRREGQCGHRSLHLNIYAHHRLLATSPPR